MWTSALVGALSVVQMSFLTDLRALADSVRAVAGPAGLGIRTNRLSIRTRTWSGIYVDEGTSTDVVLDLQPIYPIRHLMEAEVNSSGGLYETGDILVDHITPSDGAGVGYTLVQIAPHTTAQNVDTSYVITGEHPGEYNLVECRTFRPFTYQLVLRRSRKTP